MPCAPLYVLRSLGGSKLMGEVAEMMLDGTITIVGEDGAHWRYVFDGTGSLNVQQGTVVYR